MCPEKDTHKFQSQSDLESPTRNISKPGSGGKSSVLGLSHMRASTGIYLFSGLIQRAEGGRGRHVFLPQEVVTKGKQP